MTVYISLLRGINVGGHRKIKMADLKTMYEALGFRNVTTYIQSGNVVFRHDKETEPSELAAQIRTQIENTFGHAVEVAVYTLAEWRTMTERNPFLEDAGDDIKPLYVTLLINPRDEGETIDLDENVTGADQYQIAGQAIYLCYPDGYGRTKLTNNFWEKKLRVSATTRNWKTVRKLLELAEEI